MGRRLRRPCAFRLAPAGAILLAGLVACDDVVVRPVDVTLLDVVPASVTLMVGETLQLTTQAKDGEGRPISGYSVSWSSDDDAVASVDGSGRVTAAGNGSTTIRAMVGSAEGRATLTVVSAPRLVLEETAVPITADSGTIPLPVTVAVRSSGAELTDLSSRIVYEQTGARWLGVSLGETSTPTSLTLIVSKVELPPGMYRATVEVLSPAAANSPVSLPVSLDVRKGAAVPAPPSNLQASAASSSAIALSWTDNADNETGFRVEREQDGGSFAQVATVGADVTAYDDDGLAAGTTYTYRVRACNDEGCSPFTSEAAATTDLPLPSTPAGVSAVYVDSGIDVRWSDVEWEAVYRIERKVDGGLFAVVHETGANATGFHDLTVSPDRRYDYRVTACNVTGCSDPSGEVGTITPPAAPIELKAAAAPRGRIGLSWVDTSQLETQFRIERAVGNDTEEAFVLLKEIGAGSTTYEDKDVQEETLYFYRVRACNDSGCSAPTNTASFETDDD